MDKINKTPKNLKKAKSIPLRLLLLEEQIGMRTNYLENTFKYRTEMLKNGHNDHDRRLDMIEKYLELPWYKRIFMKYGKQ